MYRLNRSVVEYLVTYIPDFLFCFHLVVNPSSINNLPFYVLVVILFCTVVYVAF